MSAATSWPRAAPCQSTAWLTIKRPGGCHPWPTVNFKRHEQKPKKGRCIKRRLTNMRCPQFHGRKRRRRCNNAALPVAVTVASNTWLLASHATAGKVTIEPARLHRPVVLKLWHKTAVRSVDGVTYLCPKAQGSVISKPVMPAVAPRTLCAVPRRDKPRSRNDRFRHYAWAVLG